MIKVPMNLVPWGGLHTDDDERKQHGKALRALFEVNADCSEFQALYNYISILDSKSTPLLQFNSVILGVIALIFAIGPPDALKPWLIAVLVLGVLSSVLCLSVVWVQWATTEDINKRVHAISLLRTRDVKTILYRLACWLAIFAILVLLIGVFLTWRQGRI